MASVKSKLALITCVLSVSSSVYADDMIGKHSFYVAAKAGVFQVNFNSSYMDQTDIIPQNLAETIQQNGYTEGLAIGYSGLVRRKYLLGVEIAGNDDSHSANFQAGAASAAFSDIVQINNHFDFTFVPGILLTDSVAAYLKIGYTRASVQDTLISPVGYEPTMTRFATNTNANGFISGLGVEKFLGENFSLFAEGDYRDYGTVSFTGFQNYTASYTNSSHVYTYDVTVGAAYHF